MKRIITGLCILFCMNNFPAAQEFVFPIIFEDAVGNRDTIMLGYDSLATDSLDVAFNELNIIDLNRDSLFDVRITDEWASRLWGPNSAGTFHVKKQIVRKTCGGFPDIIVIDIKCSNWPVTTFWDKLGFEDLCRKGSLLTSINPGGWWDTGSPSDLDRVEFLRQDSVTFTSNAQEGSNENYAYITDDGDTIAVYWVAFGDSSLITSYLHEVRQLQEIVISPNPVSDYLFLQTGLDLQEISVVVCDLSGRRYSVTTNQNQIYVGNLIPGTYILQLYLKNGLSGSVKFIKQ